MADPISWLSAYFSKKKKIPRYSIVNSGPKDLRRFSCKLRVDGYMYVGIGCSTDKNDAKTIATKNFIEFLVQQKEVNESDIPKFHDDAESEGGDDGRTPLEGQGIQPLVPMASALHVFYEENLNSSVQQEGRQVTYMKRVAKRKRAEDTHQTANIHGNWNFDNAKPRLFLFLQDNNIRADFVCCEIGPLNRRSYVASMRFFVGQLCRCIWARETGTSRQRAKKRCALSLVRQLFHLKLIEAFSGIMRRNKRKKHPPYEVAVLPELLTQMNTVLNITGIYPVQPNLSDQSHPQSLCPDVKPSEFQASDVPPPVTSGVVSWAPPRPNWNSWTASNIDEWPLASMNLDQISAELQRSHQDRLQTDKALQQRAQLPVNDMRQDILGAINDNPVVIIRGNTGCGKTTQVCQFILDDYIQSGSGAYCNILVTQPKHIYAVSAAERVAVERGEELGQSIGYSVPFESVLPRPYGGVLFCTVGVLLRKLEDGLKGVSHVILDEIHERDINTDFLLVLLRDMVYAVPDVHIILMSATIDISLFTEYFRSPVVIEVPGLGFPVQEYFLEDCVELTKFTPPDAILRNMKQKNDEPEENLNILTSDSYSSATKETMLWLNEEGFSYELTEALLKYVKGLNLPGAVLIFLPTWHRVIALMRHLKNHPQFGGKEYLVLPLYSQLPCEDLQRVFESVPEGTTKIILATNIAESSITISDVVFVIDSCETEMKVFTSHNKRTNLERVWASRMNLEQRKGRAGRVRAGIYFCLCSRARFEKLEEHVVPEMFRIPLYEVAFSIKLLRLGSVREFLSKAIQAPPVDAVSEAEYTLREMKCLDIHDELTPLGQILARLPIDPHLGKMIILGCVFFCGDAMCTIAAHNSTSPEIFITSPELKRLSQSQNDFAGNRYSDHIAALSAFISWEEARARGEAIESNFCDCKGLSMPTLHITWQAKNQLKEVLLKAGFPEDCLRPQSYNFFGPDSRLDLVAALLTFGLYPNVCVQMDKRLMLSKSQALFLDKFSVNCNKKQTFPSPFFVFGETKTGVVSCKQTTMVTPIHLILLGARKVEAFKNCVRLDGWIDIKMDPDVAAKICALRPSVEDLIIHAVSKPEGITEPGHQDEQIMNCIKQLCNMNAGRHNMEQIVKGDFNTTSDGEPLFKRIRFEDGPCGSSKDYNQGRQGNQSSASSSCFKEEMEVDSTEETNVATEEVDMDSSLETKA